MSEKQNTQSQLEQIAALVDAWRSNEQLTVLLEHGLNTPQKAVLTQAIQAFRGVDVVLPKLCLDTPEGELSPRWVLGQVREAVGLSDLNYLTRALSSLLTEAGERPHSNPAELVTQVGTVMRRARRPMTSQAPLTEEEARTMGLYRKFDVRRADGSSAIGGKHEHCDYLVLDWQHDPYAVPAGLAYANACEAAYPMLAKDIRARAFTASRGEIPPEVRKCHACGGSGSVGAEGHDRDGFPHEQPCPVCTFTPTEEAEIIASAPKVPTTRAEIEAAMDELRPQIGELQVRRDHLLTRLRAAIERELVPDHPVAEMAVTAGEEQAPSDVDEPIGAKNDREAREYLASLPAEQRLAIELRRLAHQAQDGGEHIRAERLRDAAEELSPTPVGKELRPDERHLLAPFLKPGAAPIDPDDRLAFERKIKSNVRRTTTQGMRTQLDEMGIPPIDLDSGTREPWTPRIGERVRTAERIEYQRAEQTRRPDEPGEIVCELSSNWWRVQHDDGAEAPYHESELRPEPASAERLQWLAEHGGTTEQVNARAELMRLGLRPIPEMAVTTGTDNDDNA